MTDSLSAVLTKILTAELAARGWSGRELARRAVLGHSTVSAVLSGESVPKLDTLMSVLAVLDKDLSWLHKQGVRPPATASS